MKRLLGVLATTFGLTVAGLVAAPSAEAATVTANCDTSLRQMCLHYHSPNYDPRFGAEFGRAAPLYSFNPAYNGNTYYLFKEGYFGSAGAGQNVWNNAGGAENLSYTKNYRVYYNTGYDGPSDLVRASTPRELDLTKNNNASMDWVS